MHAAIVETTLDDLVPEQREHATTQEQRSRISVPIDTRRAALIVNCFIRLRAELVDFAKLQRVVSQEQNRGRVLKQVLITFTSRHADRQTEHSRLLAVGFVEEAVTALFTLRSLLARVT